MTVRSIPFVTDLGPGNGGKGEVVNKLVCLLKAVAVIKDGGYQGNHGFTTVDGRFFAVNQWGCGVADGVKTHIPADRFIFSPINALFEAEELEKNGIQNPFDLLTVDENVLCGTPYHQLSSKLQALARKENRRSTVGSGNGETYRYWQRFPELAIYARDLASFNLRDRLVAVRERIVRDLDHIVHGEFLPDDREEATRWIGFLTSDDFLYKVVSWLGEASRKVEIVDHDYLRRVVLARDGVAIVEKSHGVLTDHYQGFHPHTSAIRTLPQFTEQMLREAGYTERIVNLGIFRAFQLSPGEERPMPTASTEMAAGISPGTLREKDRYQGPTQVGPLDLQLLRYSIACAGGPQAFSGLAVTWFDQIVNNGVWHYCDSYEINPIDAEFFASDGNIKVRFGDNEAQLAHQERLSTALRRVRPRITSLELPKDATRDQLFDLVAGILNPALGVPVRMVSFGPNETNKVIR